MPLERFREISEKFGFNYGPTFSIIKKIWQCGNEGLCLVDISGLPAIQAETKSYVVHPCILDACLQSCFIPVGNTVFEDTSFVPVGFKSITLNDMPSTNQLYCHVTADVTTFRRFDVALISPSGKVILTINDFFATGLTSTERRFTFDNLGYEVRWTEEVLQRQKDTARNSTCIVLKDSSIFSDALTTRLQAAKFNVITVDLPNARCFNTEAEENIKAVFSYIPTSHSANLRVINTWPVESNLLPNNFDVIDQAQRLAFGSSVFLIQLLVEKECFNSRLFLITERTQLLSACETNAIPWSSTVWGLRRTAGLEEFNVRINTVDLNNKMDLHEVDSLVQEILGDSMEEEVAFRDGKRFINRVVRTKLSPEQPTTKRIESKERSSLYLSSIPSSKTLCLREMSFSKPYPSELTLDLLFCWTPSESLIDVAKPKGCVFVVGKVTDLPRESENTKLQIGDKVCGVVTSGRISSSLAISVNNVFEKPTSLTEQQAAYIPACLSIASHALQRVVSGDETQKLLIHEANRGPGPAAVVLATALGHKAFCTIPDTCQASAKAHLLELGAEGVMRQSSSYLDGDSSCRFDAVIFFYPPAPNALRKSSRVLKGGGRIIILSSEIAGDVVFTAARNVRYDREDIACILKSPQVYEDLSLTSLEFLKSKGVLQKLLGLQLASVDLETAMEAANASLEKRPSPKDQVKAPSSLSFLIHSFQLCGEDPKRLNIPVLPCGLDECGLKENRTYLVAGGIRGYGFEVARWMVENGAKCVGLIGRSKPSDAKCQEVRELERRTGAKIHMFQVINIPLYLSLLKTFLSNEKGFITEYFLP